MNSNNFIIVDQLTRMNNELMKQIEDLKNKNKLLDDENSELYEEILILHTEMYELNEEIDYLKDDEYIVGIDNDLFIDFDETDNINNLCHSVQTVSKSYFKDYFTNVLKEKTRYCDVCECDIKYSSYNNHIKSKRHIKNIK